jgi:hypothetical protein
MLAMRALATMGVAVSILSTLPSPRVYSVSLATWPTQQAQRVHQRDTNSIRALCGLLRRSALLTPQYSPLWPDVTATMIIPRVPISAAPCVTRWRLSTRTDRAVHAVLLMVSGALADVSRLPDACVRGL